MDYLTTRNNFFAKTPLFDKLSQPWHGFEEAGFFAYWIFTFQDILRLNLEKIHDADLKEVFTQHQLEDSGHDLWYIHDLSLLGIDLDISTLYNVKNYKIRRAVNEIISLTLQDIEDIERVILVEALEESSHTLFEHTSKYISGFEQADKLKFFSKHHLAAEENHEFRNAKIMDKIFNLELTNTKRASLQNIIDKVYIIFETIFAEALLQSRSPK